MKLRFQIFGVVLAILGLTTTTAVLAQNDYPRLSVIEEFTSATCPPCVTASGVLKQVVDLSTNKVVSIRFHQNGPAPNDPWYVDNPTDNLERAIFYGANSIPHGRVNGTRVDVMSVAPVLAKIQEDNAQGSPVSIEVTEVKNGAKYNVTVKVKTNIALTNHKLLVAVVSRFAPYPGLSQSLPNSNGEEEFYDAMNRMLGGTHGTSINIAAGKDQTFTYEYSRGSGYVWPTRQQYIVAYVQDATSKAILNGGTNLQPVKVNLEFVSPQWEKVDKGGNATKTIRVSNPTNKEVMATLKVANGDNLAQSGWTATLTSTDVIVPANGQVNVGLENTAPNRALFAGIQIDAEPIAQAETGEIPEPSTIVGGYLTNGTRVGVFYGATNGAAGNAIPALKSTYGQDVAYVPLDGNVLNAFPVGTSYDAIVLPSGFDGRFAITALVPIAQQMLDANKGVWISAPVGLAVALNPGNQQYPGYPEAKAFFENFGLSVGNTVNRNDGQYITQFQIKGVANDPIGNGWSATGNNASQSWPFYTQAQDIIALQSGKCKSFAYADNTTNNIIGVRYEEPNSTKRFVYSSFGAEVIGTESERNVFMQRVLDYLMPKPQSTEPEISVSSNSLSFGSVEVNNSLDKVVTVTNTGKSPLEINQVSISGLDASQFTITDGALSSGQIKTIQPNGTYIVKVSFKPTQVKDGMVASLVIGGNAPSKTVQLGGNGVQAASVATDAVSETGAIGLRLVGSNPVTVSSAVELNATSAVTVTVVNSNGSTVATLFNGQPAGTELVNFNASTLASGTYSIVATNGSERAVLTVVVAR